MYTYNRITSICIDIIYHILSYIIYYTNNYILDIIPTKIIRIRIRIRINPSVINV